MSVMIKVAKAALRKEIKEKLAELSVEQKLQETKIVTAKLLDHPKFQASKRISVYLSVSSEVGTMEILQLIFKHGKDCFIPQYRPGSDIMEMVKIDSLEDYESLPVTKWNIKQPKLTDNRENALENGGLDLVILPGLAFTEAGLRLGKGRGYYDRFLTKYKETMNHGPYCIGLAFNVQMVANLPAEPTDVLIDQVIYPNVRDVN